VTVPANDVRRPRVSAIIPAYRRPQQAERAVRSLFDQDLPKDHYEIIVVDSSPDLETVSRIREMAADAPCAVRVFHKEPEGPGPSRNLGAAMAAGEFLAFMDSDCRAAPGWLREALAAFEPGVGLVQGRTLPDPQQRLGVLKHYVVVERENAFYQAANIVYRRESFEQVAGFPGDSPPTGTDVHREPIVGWSWPVGGEDSEVAWLVKRRGWRSRFAPEAVVYHDVVPMSVRFWLANKRLFWLPLVARRVPEVRREFFARYFYDRAQAALIAALLGTAAAGISPIALAAWIPYVAVRASEPTRTLRGVRRPLRALFYLPRDLASLALLTAGSARYRAMVL
jgi:cellulose synthase/poly-beta-1,6-N-acetylglucosamine synthase-like glycosyltransferase